MTKIFCNMFLERKAMIIAEKNISELTNKNTTQILWDEIICSLNTNPVFVFLLWWTEPNIQIPMDS